MEDRLIILAGPTGVGKSKLGVELARRIGGEIISCDSMQIYQGLDIGSAKIDPKEMQGVPHHLLDFVDPKEEFSVARYQDVALREIRRIQKSGRIPIMVGGTGLYISSVIYPMKFTPADKSQDIRLRLELEARVQGAQVLHQRLKEKDPKAALAIHPNNLKRVIRALEVIEETGRPFSEFQEEKFLRPDLHIFYYWVSMDREKLYERINQRVEQMMAQGLLEEVKGLMARGLDKSHQSMQGIGYKECLDYLSGQITLEEAIGRIKQGSRNYAKRQITWFRNEPSSTELSKELMTEPEMLFKIESDMFISDQTPRK